MLDLQKALEKHFRFKRGHRRPDNLPYLATSEPGRSNGRVQLALTMRDMGFKMGVEIGSRKGHSAVIWKEAMPDLNLICIDPYAAYHGRSQESQDAIFREAMEKAEKHGFTLFREASLDAVDSFVDGTLDFVNIDGDHTFDAAVQDIIRWSHKVREGGLVLVHDYCTFEQSGVIKAVDSYTHCHRIDPWYVTRDLEPTAFWQRGAEKCG